MIFSFKDASKASLEAMSGGRNTIMYDKAGNPSVMVRIRNSNFRISYLLGRQRFTQPLS